jgi:hypothetical protein
MSEIEQVQNEPDGEGAIQDNIDAETGLAFEDEARGMGWVDADEFRGDPSKHVSAEQFVERGRESLPLLRKNNAKMERDMNDMRGLITSMQASHEAALQAQADALKAGFEQKMREAVADGDTEAYDAAAQQRDAIKPVQPVSAPQVNDAEAKFAAENAWFGTDAAMTGAAEAISREVAISNPGYTVEQNLAVTKTRVEAEFAHKLNPQNPRRNAPSAVEGARRGAPGKGGATFDSLPQEAKDAFAMFVRRKVFTNDDAGKKQYLSSYKKD